MSNGNPVVFGAQLNERKYAALIATTTKRDDPNSFDEKLLQTLVEAEPRVLPIRDFLPSTTATFSLAREVPVDIGGADGFIDNLLVTNDGYIVIVETKLHRNPEAIREVVTQTLQYGMAVGQLAMVELESKIRRGQKPALRQDENIMDCVRRLAATDPALMATLADDFEEALERHLRRGEILLLVVSDGFRVGVERITNWLNDQGSSSPFKFGLVELKFYVLGDQQLVIPRTVIKTREVSRHVVVVDVQTVTQARIETTVTDEFHGAAGGKAQESRLIKATVPLTKNSLMQLITSPDERSAAARLIDQLETLGFDQKGTGAGLNFGFTDERDQYHSLVYFMQGGVWTYPLKKDRDLLGADSIAEFQNKVNEYGRFFRDDQLGQQHSNGCQVKYSQIGASAAEFAALLNGYRNRLLDLLETA